jgi:colicin import membrane protein
MSSTRRLVLSFAVIAAMTGPACGGDPPDKEMQQAQSAIDAARAGGADQYARDEFTAAQDAFKRAQEAVAQHDYRLALNNALDAREQAQTAAKTVADKKAAARTDAERTLAGATASLNDARARLKAAEAARTSAKTLSASRRAIADGDAAVQKARTAFAQGAYLDAVSTATAATAGLKAAAHDLEAASPPAAHRRR